MFGVDTYLRSIVEKVLQALVAEAFDHALKCNPKGYECQGESRECHFHKIDADRKDEADCSPRG